MKKPALWETAHAVRWAALERAGWRFARPARKLAGSIGLVMIRGGRRVELREPFIADQRRLHGRMLARAERAGAKKTKGAGR